MGSNAESACRPPRLTGGGGRTDRHFPDVQLDIPPAEYGRVIASGFDAWKETHNRQLFASIMDDIEQRKVEARKNRMLAIDAVVLMDIAGERLEVAAAAPRGCVAILMNDDFSIQLRSPKTEWSISVEMRAAGLWEYGLEKLRDRVTAWLARVSSPSSSHAPRVSRFDYAIDLHAPGFTPDARPELLHQFVAHSSVKTNLSGDFDLWAAHGKVQTITLGKKNSLQIQIYDKGEEITEVSGKSWMLDLYRRAGHDPQPAERPKDIWRVECRFARSGFLKDRNIDTFEDVMANLQSLMGEALISRRLVAPVAGDSNKRRWPVHPFWSLVLVEAWDGDLGAMVPLGHKVTGRRDALYSQLVRQMAGTLRSATVLDGRGEYDFDLMQQISRDAADVCATDIEGPKKAARAADRYENVDEAR